MNPVFRPMLVAAAIVALCAWQSLGIVGAWRADPQNFFGWVPLLIWLSPLIYFWIRKPRAGERRPNPALLWTAIGLSLLGALGSVNVFHYLGLACALAGTIVWSWRNFPWLVSAMAWMPALGYFISRLGSKSAILPARLSIAAIIAAWTIFNLLRAPRKSS